MNQSTEPRATRQAALWATVVAVPLTGLLALVLIGRLAPDGSPDDPAPPTASAGAGAPSAGAGAPSAGVPPTAPVPMAATALSERPAVVCRALLSHLPAAVRHLPQRPVTDGPEQNAAYGEPPLTLACGTAPIQYPPTADLWTVNRICWYAAEEPEAVVLGTVDREVPVRVTVPRAYGPALQWVSEISEALVAAVPAAATVPDGCRT